MAQVASSPMSAAAIDKLTRLANGEYSASLMDDRMNARSFGSIETSNGAELKAPATHVPDDAAGLQSKLVLLNV